jgi:hypothetical protein
VELDSEVGWDSWRRPELQSLAAVAMATGKGGGRGSWGGVVGVGGGDWENVEGSHEFGRLVDVALVCSHGLARGLVRGDIATQWCARCRALLLPLPAVAQPSSCAS